MNKANIISLIALAVLLGVGISFCVHDWPSKETALPVQTIGPPRPEKMRYIVPTIAPVETPTPFTSPTPVQTDAPEPTEIPEPQMTYLGDFAVTGYDICLSCCGKTDGITYYGYQATVGRTCAAGTQFEPGTRLYIDGIGERIVEDRGCGIRGTRIDVLCEDHPACYAITGTRAVYLVED